MTDDADVIEAAGLRFVIRYRHFGGDEGPSAEVYVRATDDWRQALRYDCFRQDPHWHILRPPAAKRSSVGTP